MCVCIYIYIYICHGNAAIPRNQLSWEDVGKAWQNVATHAHLKRHIAKCAGFAALL